jgi:transcriptional regulator with XRE-family HTH domain
MTIRFDDIGNRLKAFRLGSGLTADQIAKRIGTSRTAVYRFEKGEVAKIETLEKLAELLDVSVPTLLGVGVEYVASAVSFFERLRQIEEASEHITVLAGPVSMLLASDDFDAAIEGVLNESIPDTFEDREGALQQVADLMPILRARKATYRARRPGMVNLISGAEIDRFLRNGLVGRLDLPEDLSASRSELFRGPCPMQASRSSASPTARF